MKISTLVASLIGIIIIAGALFFATRHLWL
ncbi:MAG: hypothetical protein CFH08_00923 [Alphaproteobacteria bacterium MarineAlpha3_Bin7]|nr:MAG: hypothetical protein CFH08_00923 [Alphaproteobacteria bacterium MarineAlpha3_Bin7]